MNKRRNDVLPLSLSPRGLSRDEAAAYIGVSPSTFDIMVGDKRMPQSKRVGRRTIWDRQQIDLAFSALPSDDEGSKFNPWDLAA
jgi:predicted DNA-binding transcriptional regulator AlpA